MGWGVVVLCAGAQGAFSLGLHEPASNRALFLTSPANSSLGAAITRTNGRGRDATGYLLTAQFRLKGFFVGMEVPYWNVVRGATMEDDFGDILFRARGGLLSSPFHLYAEGSLRTGTGSSTLYPYSSSSIDVELGAAMVDSLSLLVLYGELTATKVNRKPKGLPRPRRHDDFVRMSLGIVIPLHRQTSLYLGGSGLVLFDGGSREAYFCQVLYQRSPALGLFLAAQAEAGESALRAEDFAFTMGALIYY